MSCSLIRNISSLHDILRRDLTGGQGHMSWCKTPKFTRSRVSQRIRGKKRRALKKYS